MKFQTLVFCLLVLLLTDYSYAAAKSSISKDSAAAAPAKSADKISYPKKVSTLKKRPSKASLKKVADITDKFKDLPADDLAFIKELDKQFKQHGGKVKIKVENDNATTTSGSTKNSKRTIEGELGYGYSHNGYDYNPPKYEFYPYSQKDIPSDGPKYYLPNGKTEVSVEPSYSYELKPQTYVSHHHGAEVDLPHPEIHAEHQQQQAEQPIEHVPQQEPQQQHYEEPVIVLRIPGPAKYASHLQTLLQQYLEIRAAQYLRILEEAEHHKLQQEQPQQHLQEIDYGHASAEEQGGHQLAQGPAEEQYQQHQQHYYQQPQHQQQVEYEQQPQYPAIDDVYQHYKQRHHSHPEQAQQPEGQGQVYYVPGHPAAEQQQQHYVPQQHQQQHQQQEQPQFYYTHQQEYAQPEGPPANTYQHVFLISMTPQVHPGYEAEKHHHHHQQQQHQQEEEEHQTIYVPEQPEAGGAAHGGDSALPISENNPRPSHTKVLFTHDPEHAGADYSNAYPLPSIKPNERHAPHSVPDYHQDYQQQVHPHALQQDYQQQVHQQESQESAQHYQQPQDTAPAQHQQVVAITQRPFNYHAHGMKPRARGRSPYKRRASNTAVPKGDQDLQKIRDYVRDNLGAQTGTAVEYKTTQVINP